MPDPEEASAPPIDVAHLSEIASGDTEFLQDLARTFIEDTARRIEHLRALLEAGDTEALHEEAHAVKGACSNFCAEQLREVALELEEIGASGDLSRGAVTLDRFTIEFERLRCFAARKFAA